MLFLGSTIGNFSHPADVNFLRDIRRILQSGDALLLGTDLEKPIPQLIDAYDDPLGVTAAFNLNLLARINRELEGGFVLRPVRTLCAGSIPKPGVSKCTSGRCGGKPSPSEAPILPSRFEEGETIWTENSHKYSLAEVARMAEVAGFGAKPNGSTRNGPLRRLY